MKNVETIEEIEYLTVAEFAERAGVTKQAVYKRLNNQLQKYVIEQNGRKLIKSSALNDLYSDVSQAKSQPVEQPLNNQLIELFKAEKEEKQKIIDMLLQEKSALQMKLTQKEHQLQLLEENKETAIRQDQRIKDLEDELGRSLDQLEDVRTQLQKAKQHAENRDDLLERKRIQWAEAERRATDLQKQLEEEQQKSWWKKLLRR
jgi:transcriptional regulator with XRE-family HTH domain